MKQTKRIIGAKLQHRTTNNICTIIEIDEDGAKVQYEKDNKGNTKTKYYKNTSLNSKFSLYKENSNSIKEERLEIKDNLNNLNDIEIKEPIQNTEPQDNVFKEQYNLEPLYNKETSRLLGENERLSKENERLSKENENLFKENEILKNKLLKLESTLKSKKHKGGKISKFKEEDISRMIDYYRQGESYRTIAQKFSCSSAYVYKIIKNNQNKTLNE